MSSRATRITTCSSPDYPFISKKIGTVIAGMLAAFMLVGCAAQMAFREGKDLVAKDKVEEGLLKFQEASRKDPQSIEYRTAFLQTRERAIAGYFEQADRLASAGKREEAEKFYQRILALDGVNVRARDGLRNLDMDARHVQQLKDAGIDFEKNNIELARQKIANILAENPSNEAARLLSRSITEKTAKPSVESALSVIYKKPISIEFRDGSLKQVFEVISRSSGLNFLFDKDVKTDQRTSIYLKNSTIESAVYYTLLTNQLEQQVLDANTVLIYPNTVAKQKEYQEMMIQSFFLTSADAKTVANTLKTILKTRDVVVDEKLNMLIVRDNAEAIKLAERLVSLHDVAEPEVMLEVEILEVKRTRLMELGIKWPDSLTLTPLSPLGTGGLTISNLYHQNSGTIGVGNPAVTINARKDDSDANLLANPRIRARNHEKAKILIGERVPNITTTATSTGFVSESIAYVDVGLKLDVEPTIYLDNDVAIKVSLEVSNIVSQLQTKSGTVAYQIGTRTASTVLRLKDGETQVLAGLINDEDRRSASKIPVLGDIPILGHLFGSTGDDKLKTEIVLSITPRLIRNIQRPEIALAKFRAGTETSMRQRPDSAGRGVATAPSVATGAAAAGAQQVQSRPPVAADNPVSGDVKVTPSNSPQATGSGSGTSTMIPSTETAPMPAPAAEAENAAGGVPASVAQVQWKGPSQSRVGSNFSVQLTMQSNEPISSLPITLGFDSKVLQVVRVVEGDFLKQGGAQTTFSNQVDPSGQILITASSNGGDGAAGSGTVAIVTFRSVSAADASNIQVLSVLPISAAGRAVTVAEPSVQAVRVQP